MAVYWNRGVILAAAVAGVLAGSTRPAPAQFRVMPRIIAQPAGESGADEQGVYVKDSAIATDKLDLAERMEKLKEWHKSADVYQELIEKYKDRVVATQRDARGQPTAYSSVIIKVEQNISRWPEDGLTVYRTRFEPMAATLLEQAGKNDFATLHRVFDEYFATDSAKRAGMRLMELYLDDGDFAASAWIGDKLLDLHPNLLVERPAVLFRTAVAYHLAGNDLAARRRFEELKSKSPDATGTVAGHDLRLVDELEKQLAMPTPMARGSGADSWRRSIGGNESNDQVSSARTSIGAPMWHIDFPPPVGPDAVRSQWDAARKMNKTVNIFPAVDRGEMFFQDGQRVWAVHVESGTPLPGWQQTYAQRNGVYLLPVQSFTAGDPFTSQQINEARQNTVAVTDDAVLAVMGYPDLRALSGMAQGESGTRLVCLDRATGKERWIANPNSIPKSDAGARMLNFSGEPLVVGDNVYTIMRGSTAAGVEDCHVVCYDLESGRFKWDCYIASSQNGYGLAAGNAMAVMQGNSTLSHLAFASGRVFVCTNLGAVGAVDAYSGATAWLTIYDRDDDSAQLRGPRGQWGWNGQMQQPTDVNAFKPWEFNPVIVSDGKVFVFPIDAKAIHVYDAGTGRELRQIPEKIRYSDSDCRIRSVVSASGNRIVLLATNEGGNSQVIVLNWEIARFTDRTPNDDSVIFFTSVSPLVGRPFVTSTDLFLPLQNSMCTLSTQKWRIQQAHQWPAGEGPGNVMVSRDNVIVANASNITVYTDMAGVRQKYQKLIASDPGNVDQRLTYAALLFNAKEVNDAIRELDGAIDVLGGRSSMARGAGRDRVFSDAISFAKKLGAQGNSAMAQALFDRAKAAISTASQGVDYRLSRAHYIESTQDKPALSQAVTLYQQVLADPAMRIVTVSGEEAGASRQAGKVAEEAIAQLVKRAGAGVYEEFEKQAADRFNSLKQAGSADDLLKLADNYPNAAVAPQAMLQAAHLYEKSQPRLATQVLRRLYWKYGAQLTTQRASLMEAMGRNYLRIGNAGAALGRFQRAVSLAQKLTPLTAPLLQDSGQPLLRADGQPVATLGDAVAALEQLAEKQSSQALPDLHLPDAPWMKMTSQQKFDAMQKLARKEIPDEAIYPRPFLPEKPESTLSGIESLLEPPVELSDLSRHDRVLAWTPGKLLCLSPGNATPLWTNAQLGQGALEGAAWLDEGQLLVWGDRRVALLDARTGNARWMTPVDTLPAVQLLNSGITPVAQNNAPVDPLVQQQRILGRGPGPMLIRANAAGRVLILPQQAQLPGAVAPPPAPQPGDGQERVVSARPAGDRIILSTSTGRVAALEIADGRLAWQTRLTEGAGIQQTLATDDFVVVRLADAGQVQLVALDASNGQQVMRRAFAIGQGNNWPINCALSPDGTLVWTTSSSIAAKDLYEPGDAPNWEKSRSRYDGCTEPDQLQIFGQDVLAVCEEGRNIERRALADGEQRGLLLEAKDRPSSGPVAIRISGQRLYAGSAHVLFGYNLGQGTSVKMMQEPNMSNLAAQMMISNGYVLMPMQRSEVADGSGFSLRAYSRQMSQGPDGKMSESGMEVYKLDIDEPSKVKSWVAAEGGLYYLSGDGKLHWLAGARK